MYRFSVPINNRTFFREPKEPVVEQLRAMGVHRVFLTVGSYHFDERVRREEFETLKENCAYLHSQGFVVGAWLWTFMDNRRHTAFTPMRTVGGVDMVHTICPTDESFRDFAGDYLCEVAACGVDEILFDDDYRFGEIENHLCCLCDNHLAMMERILGEPLTREQVAPYLISGGKNRYRDAWQVAKRESLLGFANAMRAALDRDYPNTRLGVCACYTVWDMDGASPLEISRALAGNTRPLLRLIGAPYWAVRRSFGGFRLQDVIEFERMQLSFCEGADDVEIISEGDSYPRPRWVCPAAYVEGVDQALRADGRLQGILKYTMDYTASVRYERGYVQTHLRNLPLYERIDELFGDKTTTGVSVFEHRLRYADTLIPRAAENGERTVGFLSFSYASRMLSAGSIPTVIGGGEGVMAVFGENAKYLPLTELKRGVILDARAAEILTERGVDVGLLDKGEEFRTVAELFLPYRELIAHENAYAYRMTVREGAVVESLFLDGAEMADARFGRMDGEQIAADRRAVGSYRYENANGERFLVLGFDGMLAAESLLRQYMRADQIKNALSYLGQPPAAVAESAPDLYLLLKQKGSTYAAGLWNFSPDAVEEPRLILTGGARLLRTVGCTADLADGAILLSRIEPYGFVAVEWEAL